MRQRGGLLRASLAVLWLGIALVGAAPSPPAAEGDAGDEGARRAAMVAVIERYAEDLPSGVAPEGLSREVLDAMRRVPRHEFVPQTLRAVAYEDRPLPIGYGQTISQPFIVALMTHLLRPEAGQRVLELGTGSGYQAAVLADLGVETYSIEIVPDLGTAAAARLRRLGYDRVRTRVGDGYFGWPDAAPFDGILVTAAASHVPPPLIEQLRPGGRMVVPVGPPFMVQQLVLVTKHADGGVRTRQLLPVRFVPLTGER